MTIVNGKTCPAICGHWALKMRLINIIVKSMFETIRYNLSHRVESLIGSAQIHYLNNGCLVCKSKQIADLEDASFFPTPLATDKALANKALSALRGDCGSSTGH